MSYVEIATLRGLMQKANKRQIAAARAKAIDYLLTCRLNDIQPEDGGRVLKEALEVELLEANETPVEREDPYTARSYASVYSGGYDVDQRTVSYRRVKD